MLKNGLNRRTAQVLSWIIYFVVVCLQVMVTFGWGLPRSFSMVMDEYVNLYRPQPWTFWIHFFILAWAAVTLAVPWLRSVNPSFALAFDKGFRHYYIQWLLLHGVLLVAWSYRNFVIVVGASAWMMSIFERIVSRIRHSPHFQKYPWLLKIPANFQYGWSIVLMFQSLSMLGISFGLMRNGMIAMMWAGGLLFLTVVMISYNYVKYGTIWLMIPLVWFEVGLVIDRYIWRNYTMMRVAVVGLGITLIIFGYIYYLHKEEKKNK